jgi:hypothetical protein
MRNMIEIIHPAQAVQRRSWISLDRWESKGLVDGSRQLELTKELKSILEGRNIAGPRVRSDRILRANSS